LDADVGQFTVVSGTKRVEVDEIQGVGVRVVSNLGWDNWCSVVRIDEGEVIRSHNSQTLSVLINKRVLAIGSTAPLRTTGRAPTAAPTIRPWSE